MDGALYDPPGAPSPSGSSRYSHAPGRASPVQGPTRLAPNTAMPMEGNGGQHNPQQALAALARAGAALECPSCGGTVWAREPNPVVVPISPAPGEVSGAEGIPTYALICVRCGFVRLHALKALLDDTDAPRS
jgi:hypothetical protein